MAEKNELLKTALDQLKTKETTRDEAGIYAEGWAVSFRKLSHTQKIFAKRAMDEILILGQLEELTLNSVPSPTLSSASYRTSTPCVIPVQVPALSPIILDQSSNLVSYNNSGNEEASDTHNTFEDLILDTQYN